MALEKLAKIPSLVRKAGQSASKAQPFYSNVDQVIANITQGTGTGAQMLAELLKTKGVAKELKDRPAIKKTLEANKDAKVTKADLERLAAENPPPQIQEKSPSLPFDVNNPSLPSNNSLVLGPNPHYPHGRPDLPIGVFERETGELITAGQTERDAILDAFSEMPEFWNGAAETTSAFRKYTIPGGENYREILLRLPEKKNQPIKNEKSAATMLFEREMMEKYGGNSFPSVFNRLSPNEIDKYEMYVREDRNASKTESLLQDRRNNYSSTHFNEPNILAHARVTDRVGPNGEKILHVEEIQSDWHQAGRKKGYKTPDIEARLKESEKEMEQIGLQIRGINNRMAALSDNDLDEFNKLAGERQTLYDRQGFLIDEGNALIDKRAAAVPDAPFKQNWHELVMKRLLDDAARNGYDRVVITPGAEQAKRYDLSKQISRVVYSPTTETLNAFDNSGKSVLMKSGITPERVEDYIGKEPAKRLLDPQNTKSYLRGGKEDSYHEITGEDLRVGGEGMKGFYDQIVPSYLNDYGKRYGVQVGTYNLPDPNVHHIPTMADIQRGGMEMFGRADLTPEETLQVENAFRAQRSAETAIPLHSFDITPQMREDITTKGVPLYQAAPPVAIGAGAMQEEQPSEYAGGGAVRKALKAVLPKGQQAILPAAESAANLDKFLADSVIKKRLYHGTSQDFPAYSHAHQYSGEGATHTGSGFYFTDNPESASRFAEVKGTSGANVQPVYLSIKNPLEFDWGQGETTGAKINLSLKQVKDIIQRAPNIKNPDESPLVNWGDIRGGKFDAVLNEAAKSYAESSMLAALRNDFFPDSKSWLEALSKATGHDSAMTVTPSGDTHYIAWFPEQIKSAIGNVGEYDITNPDITKAKGGRVTNDAMWMAVQNKQLRKKHGN